MPAQALDARRHRIHVETHALGEEGEAVVGLVEVGHGVVHVLRILHGLLGRLAGHPRQLIKHLRLDLVRIPEHHALAVHHAVLVAQCFKKRHDLLVDPQRARVVLHILVTCGAPLVLAFQAAVLRLHEEPLHHRLGPVDNRLLRHARHLKPGHAVIDLLLEQLQPLEVPLAVADKRLVPAPLLRRRDLLRSPGPAHGDAAVLALAGLLAGDGVLRVDGPHDLGHHVSHCGDLLHAHGVGVLDPVAHVRHFMLDQLVDGLVTLPARHAVRPVFDPADDVARSLKARHRASEHPAHQGVLFHEKPQATVIVGGDVAADQRMQDVAALGLGLGAAVERRQPHRGERPLVVEHLLDVILEFAADLGHPVRDAGVMVVTDQVGDHAADQSDRAHALLHHRAPVNPLGKLLAQYRVRSLEHAPVVIERPVEIIALFDKPVPFGGSKRP